MTATPPPLDWRIVPEGDRCLLVEFGRAADGEVTRRVQAFARRLMAEAIPGVVDVVPAFTTVAIHYRPESFDEGGGFAYDALRHVLGDLLARGIALQDGEERSVEIPVCYGGEFGPDLPDVAAACGCTPDEVIERHVASAHTVGMIGFAPGFPYISGLDPALQVPRRATPRTQVPAGSVAIAGRQSSIYTLETPGGWNLIGRTPLKLFDLSRESPCLLQPGDRLRFVPITAEAYRSMRGGQG